MSKKQKRLMVIDALNNFLRNYVIMPHLAENGQPIGGTIGFLFSIQKLADLINPDEIIICWDGTGGSRKRRQINKNYKAGRKPLRLNRNIRNLTENEEKENKMWQLTRTIKYLNNFPIAQLVSDNVEADDVISYVVQLPDYKDWQKVIVSNDKDFIQLLNDETILYRPTQLEVLNSKSVVEKYNIHPTNFALARAIAGDKSDNLPGVKGVGLPTIAKRLPFLSEDKTYTIDEIDKYCKSFDSNLRAYNSIVENKELIQENYKLMQLYSPAMSVQSKNKIKHIIRNNEYIFNQTHTFKMLYEDGIASYDWSRLSRLFKNFVRKNKENEKVN